MMTAIAKQLNTALRREYGADIADGVQRYLHEEQFDDESIVDDIKDGVESTIVEQVHMLLGDIAIKPSLVEIHAVLSNMLRAKPKPVSRSPTGTQQLNEQKSKLKPVHGTAHTHLHPPMMLPLHEWDTMVSEHELQHIADLVHKQCGELLPSSKITVDRNLLTVLYLGKKHDLPLLTYLTDAYHRYLLQYHQRKTATELSTNGWFEFCKHNKASAIYAISTKPNAERLWMLYASAINAYCSRMVHVPKLQAMHKIDDSIDIIALYIIRCYQFILNYLTQQHKINDSRLIPTQIDFWIVPQGVRSMLARSQRSYDEDDDDDDDEDIPRTLPKTHTVTNYSEGFTPGNIGVRVASLNVEGLEQQNITAHAGTDDDEPALPFSPSGSSDMFPQAQTSEAQLARSPSASSGMYAPAQPNDTAGNNQELEEIVAIHVAPSQSGGDN
mmetsp:Transcript_26594/g.43529  ORF Transcript_26594/g.43529 Transcript_26594/m.43529 type:complete len:441 (+) Transcript_26594:1674-2996(+)